MLAVLRTRNFMLLWIGGLISSIGDWVLQGALPFYVYARTGSALATGLAFIATAFPYIILPSFAGVLVDKWDRKRTMLIADLARAILVPLLLLAISYHSLLWLIYLISFSEACITQFFNPAESALVPTLVKKDVLQQANALNSLGSSSARLIGPLLGGFLFATLGIASTVIVDSVSYLFSASMIILLIVPRQEALQTVSNDPIAAQKTYWHNLQEGLHIIQHEHMISRLFIVVALAALAEGVINPLFAIFPKAVLHLGPAQYGEMLTALGIGSIIGSLIIGQCAKLIAPSWLLWLGLLSKGLLYLLAYNSRAFPIVLALFVLSGIPSNGFQISTQTIMQTRVEDRLRGRVFGVYVALVSGLLVVGTGIGSGLATSFGVIAVLNIGCILLIVSGIVAGVLMRGQQGQPTQVAPYE